MKIRGIIWLDVYVEKLAAKHAVSQREIREVFNRGGTKFRFVENGHQENEDVYAAMGRTEPGRFLIVFFVRKPEDKALVFSARDMTNAERRRYEKK